jgi:aspartate-semialdehyde dehydrogenase
VHMDVNPESVSGHGGFLAVPHPLASVLAELLLPLEREFGIAEVTAIVVRPAADFGKDGVDELREQTVGLLNFADVPTKTFGRQLAFNIIPQHRLPAEPSLSDVAAAKQVADLLGWEESRMALTWVAAPVFYGHGMQLRLRFQNGSTIERIREVVAASREADGADAAAPETPMDVIGKSTLSLSNCSEDGLGGFWVWAVAGEAGRRAAEQAVRLAAEVVDL